MRILFISKDLIAGNLAILLKEEGHEVKLFIEEKERRNNLDGMVPKTTTWRKDLTWVGKDGLIIFDDVGYGRIQDSLRKKGYRVFGGCEKADLLEEDREFGQEVFSKCGLKTLELRDFENLDDAVTFAKENPAPWVIKRNDSTKFISYVSQLDSGEDAVSLMRNYMSHKAFSDLKVSLQRRVDGVEIGLGRYFNGKDWVGPIEFNIEHVKFLPGDHGPITSEMGTLAWYSDNLDHKLFKDTLGKMTSYLREIKFIGDFGLNCIVNKEGAFILEATSRFGSPIVHLQSEIHSSPWGEFLNALVDGKDYDLKWKKGFGIVVALTVPPFPFEKRNKDIDSLGINIYYNKMSKKEASHLHFEEVSLRANDLNQQYISDSRGYVMYVTGVSERIEDTQKNVYSIIDKIIIPKMMFRNDIGTSFMNKNKKYLESLGYKF